MLRNSKIALPTDATTIREFKTALETLARVPLDDYRQRVTVAHEVFSDIKNSIDTINNPSFEPSAEFLQVELPELMKTLRKEFRDGWYHYLHAYDRSQILGKVFEFSMFTNKINAKLPSPSRDMRGSLFTFT